MSDRFEEEERPPELHITPEEHGRRGGFVMPMVRPARMEASELVAHGIVGGLLAGVAVAIVAMIVALILGRGVGLPARQVAGIAYGTAAMSGYGPVIVGIVLHFVTAVALGVVFALIAGRFDPSLFWWGMLYGVVVWALAEYIALPLVNRFMVDSLPPLLFLLYHLVYGATLGSYLAEGRGE